MSVYIPDEYELDADMQGDYDDDDYEMEGDLEIEGDDDGYLELLEDDDDISGLDISGDDDEIGFNLRRLFGRGRSRRRTPVRRSRRVIRRPRRTIRRSFARPAPRRVVRSALASSPVPRGVTSMRITPPKADGYSMLPLDTGANVAAGATATISAQCQQGFKPMSIVFDSVVAPDFVVTSIKCGNDEQVVGSGEMPASNFSPENAQNQLNLAPIPAALSLVITVKNTSGAPRRLRGSASGYKFS